MSKIKDLSPNKYFRWIVDIVQKVLERPSNAWQVIVALIRGTLYIIFYRIAKRSVQIRFPFFAFYSVNILGPGVVSIDKNCSVVASLFDGLTIATLSNQAVVSIGGHCILGGATIRCRNHIEIKDNVMTANTLIQDEWFCEVEVTEHRQAAIARPTAISIGRNVWLSLRTCVLGGSIIAEDSVVSAGAVTYDFRGQSFSLLSGNPVSKCLSIQSILRLGRKA